MYQNLIFDWSGVINDNVKNMYQTILAMFAHFGADPISFDEFRNQWRLPYMDFYNSYLPNISIEQEKSFFTSHINQFPTLPYPGICQLLHELKQKQKNLFVLSSDTQETFNRQLDSYGLKDVFNHIYINVYDKSLEYKKLISSNQLDLQKTVTIGDTTDEINCGHQRGIDTIGVTWGIHPREKLLLANPTYIVDTVSELASLLS